MAISNLQIMETYKAEHGLLGTPLNTYGRWKELGYKVKKGEKSQHRLTLWKPVRVVNRDTDTVTTKLILKNCTFFTPEQVERIK